MTSTGMPPILRPRWSSASSNELRMSLPITAVGPLKVETKPILMLSAASTGCASARTVAPASQNAFFIFTPLLIFGFVPLGQGAPHSGHAPSPKPVVASVILCAKSSARSKHEPKAPIRTFGSYPSGLHHNSLIVRMARIIVGLIYQLTQER